MEASKDVLEVASHGAFLGQKNSTAPRFAISLNKIIRREEERRHVILLPYSRQAKWQTQISTPPEIPVPKRNKRRSKEQQREERKKEKTRRTRTRSHHVRPHRLFHPHFRALATSGPPNPLPLRLAKLSPRPPPPPRLRLADAPVGSKNPKPPLLPSTPGAAAGNHDDPIQRRRARPRRRGLLVPAAPPALRVRRRVRLLPRLLLLPLPAAHLPGAARPGRGARRRARREATQAAVRPQPGVRAVPPGGVAHVPRRGGGVGRGATRRRLPLPQHHAALHRREPQQGGHPVRRHGARRHVPRGAARGGGGARVRAARAQHPPAPDPRHRRPLQRAADRRAGSHPRRRDQRPRRAPHHRRRRRQDPRARLLLAKSAGVGGLRDRHQPEEPVAQVQAVRRGRAKRVGTKQPPPPQKL